MFDQFLSFFQLGLFHILDLTSWDHILFLVVLSVPFTFDHWKRLFVWLAVFTLAHFVALLLVYLSIIKVSTLSLSFLIPMIILIIAFYNVLKIRRNYNTGYVGFLFVLSLISGAIHGFASIDTFANQLNTESAVYVNMVSFNVGLLMGQVLVSILGLILGFLGQTLLRFSRRDWVLFTSALVMGLVIPMLIKHYPW